MEKEQNRTFLLMKKDALAMLEGRSPEDIAMKSGILYDAEKKCFRVDSLGRIYAVSWPECECTEMGFWQLLSVMHCFHMADGSPLSGEVSTMGEMPSGMIRGGNFDRTAAKALADFANRHSEDEVRRILTGLGGEVLDGKADLSVRLPYLPRVPFVINIWFADEEFPPSARLLVDKSISHYFSVEDAVAAGEFLLELLKSEQYMQE